MADRDVLSHLLEIEANASTLVDEARSEGQRRVDAAEKSGQEAYRTRMEALRAQLGSEFAAASAAVDAEYRESLDSYRAEVEAQVPDEASFRDAVEPAVFGGEGGND